MTPCRVITIPQASINEESHMEGRAIRSSALLAGYILQRGSRHYVRVEFEHDVPQEARMERRRQSEQWHTEYR